MLADSMSTGSNLSRSRSGRRGKKASFEPTSRPVSRSAKRRRRFSWISAIVRLRIRVGISLLEKVLYDLHNLHNVHNLHSLRTDRLGLAAIGTTRAGVFA